jgi:ethanolamine utilization protein EutP
MSGRFKRIMLLGPVGCGKTTLCQALNDISISYKKTQAVEVVGDSVDTPGEYLENRAYYKALIVTSTQVETVLLLQDCTDTRMIYPPALSSMFAGKEVLGVITKVEAPAPPDAIERAHKKLVIAGARRIFNIDSVTGYGLDELRQTLFAPPHGSQ